MIDDYLDSSYADDLLAYMCSSCPIKRYTDGEWDCFTGMDATSDRCPYNCEGVTRIEEALERFEADIIPSLRGVPDA